MKLVTVLSLLALVSVQAQLTNKLILKSEVKISTRVFATNQVPVVVDVEFDKVVANTIKSGSAKHSRITNIVDNYKCVFVTHTPISAVHIKTFMIIGVYTEGTNTWYRMYKHDFKSNQPWSKAQTIQKERI